MKAYLITTIIGCFGVDNKKVISFKLFQKYPDKIAEKLKLSETELIQEEKDIIRELKKNGFDEIVFSFQKSGVSLVEPNNDAENFIKENLRNLAIKYNFVSTELEFNQIFSKITIESTKIKIKKSVERDKLVIHANNEIEEIEKTLNIFIERLREFYGMHFPEMNRAISDHEKFARLIETYGSRDKMDIPELKQISKRSIGIEFEKEDIDVTKSLASEIVRLFKMKVELTKYLEKLLKEIAPNTVDIGGTMITAKLISKAGSLEKLSKMTSSTIQLLGSEKALFKSLHSDGLIPTPKHGFIATHPYVQNAPHDAKGKIARLLAAKLSIASKMDFFSKKYRGDSLKKDLQERVKETLRSK
jgi:nucleolar protein 56